MKWHGMKWRGMAVGCVTAAATLVMTGLAPAPPARAQETFTGQWVNYQNTNECLGVLGGNMANDTPVVTWTCNGHPDQNWKIVTFSGPNSGPQFISEYAEIQDLQDPGKCLDVHGSATNDGAALVIWDCNGSTSQLWVTYQSSFPPCFNMQNFNTWPQNMVVGALGGNPTDGTQVVLWDFEPSHPDQYWCPALSPP